jgi:hypothetical protein
MAKTRTQIKAMVQEYTKRGVEKATVIENACDEALKIAIGLHPFKDAESDPSDITISADAVSVALTTISNLVHIVSARVLEAASSRTMPLSLRDRVWWDRNVINPSDNSAGWPLYAMKRGTTLYIDRPAQSGLTLRLRVVTDQVFATDATVCPVAVLDNFIVDYATYKVFAAIENATSAMFWRTVALGPNFENPSVPESARIGGSLMLAINSDKYDLADDMQAGRAPTTQDGLSVENLTTGDTDTWY